MTRAGASPRTLVIAVGVVGAGLIATFGPAMVNHGQPAPGGSTVGATTPPTPTATSPHVDGTAVDPTQAPTTVVPTSGPTASRALAGPLTVAQRFVAAWARPDLPEAQWLAGVTPWCEPSYAALLATVDPANVPATAVTGAASIQSARAGLIVVAIPTDAGTVTVTVADLDGRGRWLVTTHELDR